MRIDHLAYQKATRVAAFGLALQFVIGLTLLIFGQSAGDTTFSFASSFVFAGVFVWLSLIVVFYQHKLERLEALEADELASSRAGLESAFDATPDVGVAARRLELMHKWLMPVVSLGVALYLGLMAYQQIRFLGRIDGPTETAAEFFITQQRGWALAITLAFALVSFIFSRFVAGMAKQPAWQNLRGGAGYMVGNSLVMLAMAAGIAFVIFGNDLVMRKGVAYAIPIFMIFVAAEIILNFILNLYRPRIPGETPRPAFDSKVLSLLAAPDSLVRSLNEAINYQFGFDITSSWGYRLLLRSFAGLLALAAVVLITLNMMVIVEPHQQAVKLRGGKIVGDTVHGSGVMWKLPWPFETAEIYDVARLRMLPLTARRVRLEPVVNWSDPLTNRTDVEMVPFVVRAGGTAATRAAARELLLQQGDADTPGEATSRTAGSAAIARLGDDDRFSRLFALVDAEVILMYKIKDTPTALLEYLRFSSDVVPRRQRLQMRELALRAIALREVTRRLSQMNLDEVLAPQRATLLTDLRTRIQAEFDRFNAGVEVLSLSIPMLRPSGEINDSFIDFSMAKQEALQRKSQAMQFVAAGFAQTAGSSRFVEPLIAEIDRYNEMRRGREANEPEIVEQRLKIERMLVEGGGLAAQIIAQAEGARWTEYMDARAEASRIMGEIPAYETAPELYRQQVLMDLFSRKLADVRKVVLGIDPSRVQVDINLKELSSPFAFEGQKPETSSQGSSQ